MKKSSENDKHTEEAIKRIHEARNKLITEAVIAAWLDTHTVKETADILREFADQLEQYC